MSDRSAERRFVVGFPVCSRAKPVTNRRSILHAARQKYGATILVLLFLPFAVLGAGTNWMGSLDGRLSLARLLIPGTHNSAALLEPFPGTAKCQNLTLAGQLEAGVRFLDIRCRHLHNSFAVYHGPVNQEISFDDVLQVAARFLTNHPRECVLMSIKEESTPSGSTNRFADTFRSYVARNPGLWRLAPGIPTLDQARGKIVLFRRFAGAGGIDASHWPDNAAFQNGDLRVQDCYRVSDIDKKWSAIRGNLEESRTSPSGLLHVNFTSGYQTFLGVPDIPGVASRINPRLAAFLATNAPGCRGVLVMDFIDADKCSLVINANKDAASVNNAAR
jgi:hypothetical protein